MNTLGTCATCGGESIRKLCSYCSGERKRVKRPLIDADAHAKQFELGLETCREMISPVLHAAGEDEGRAVLACVFMIEALIACTPQLPPLEWYLARVLELPKPEFPFPLPPEMT